MCWGLHIPQLRPDQAWLSAFQPSARPPVLGPQARTALQGLTAWSFFAAISTKMIERIFSGAVTRYVPTHCFLVFPLMTVAGFLCLS